MLLTLAFKPRGDAPYTDISGPIKSVNQKFVLKKKMQPNHEQFKDTEAKCHFDNKASSTEIRSSVRLVMWSDVISYQS